MLISLAQRSAAIVFGLLYFCWASVSLAHENPSPFSDDLFVGDSAMPIVLSASRLRQTVENSPAAITIIDREMIDGSGARSIVDLLRLVPGFQVGLLLHGIPVATYHGVSGRYNLRLQVLIDGRPAYVPLYGGVSWSDLPVSIEDIERIEVTRAPNGASYGPNSFYAVVSIITRAPAAESGWLVNLQAGGNEFGDVTAAYYGSLHDIDYRVRLQGQRSEGYENKIDRQRAALFTLSSGWQVNSADRLGLDFGFKHGGHTEPYWLFEPDDYTEFLDVENRYVQFVWERARHADDSWRLQLSHSDFITDDDDSAVFDLGAATGNPDLQGIDVNVDIPRYTRSSRQEVELQRTLNPFPGHRVVLGAALRQDAVEGGVLFGDDRTRSIQTQRVFGHSEWSLGKSWVLNSGLLAEHNSQAGNSLSPRLGANYRVSPQRTVRLGYSRGLRAPLALEENGDIVLNFDLSNGDTLTDVTVVELGRRLDFESIDVFDIGYNIRRVDRSLSFDMRLSHQIQRDLIETREVPSDRDNIDGFGREYLNRQKYTSSHAEFQLDVTPRHNYRLRLNYSYTFGEDAVLEDNQLMPRHTVSLYAQRQFAREISVSGEYYYISPWVWDDERELARINRLDLRFAKTWALGQAKIDTAVQAELDVGNNIDYTDRNNVENLYFISVGFKLP